MKPASSGTLRIGRADLADATEILALQKLAYESEARLYQDWRLPPLTQTLESLREEIVASMVLGARDDSGLVGSVRACWEGGQALCRIGRLVVRPDRQGAGIGSRLMREIEASFPEAPGFELFTGHRSVGNLRLYERLGYRRREERAVSPAVTLVFLEKRR